MVENFITDAFTPTAKIVVIGVGGAGNNAVNRMINDNIQNVDFWVANTDKQALSTSIAPYRLILGEDITGGLGAGGEPEIGEAAAEASTDAIREIVKDANMVFIAAGMGGGTGTGAAPVVARIAKDSGALVVAIVTRPFTFEGNKRTHNSISGLQKLKNNVDSLIMVSNDNLLMSSGNAPINEAFAFSDSVLSKSVRTVVELIQLPGVINLDFADVRATLKESGVSLIGFGSGRGTNRAKEAAADALNSPLLEASITGARRAIVSVTCGPKVSLYDAQETVNLLINASGHNIDVKFGVSINAELDDEILVSVIASDFEEEIDFTHPISFTKPIERPVEANTFSPQMPEETPTQPAPEHQENEQSDLSNWLPDWLNN